MSACELGDHIHVFEKHWSIISDIPSKQQNCIINVIALPK